jgi:serine/threonine-protein kinase HipA
MNPSEYGDGLKLNVSETDNAQDLALAREVAIYFRMNAAQSHKIIQEVTNAVKYWRKEAELFGLSKKSQDKMASAFRLA